MKHVAHKDFFEIAKEYAIKNNSIDNVQYDGDITFMDSFQFANAFIEDKRKMTLQEIERLKHSEIHKGIISDFQHKYDMEFYYITGWQTPLF